MDSNYLSSVLGGVSDPSDPLQKLLLQMAMSSHDVSGAPTPQGLYHPSVPLGPSTTDPTSGDTVNHIDFSSPEYQAIIARARQAPDYGKYKETFAPEQKVPNAPVSIPGQEPGVHAPAVSIAGSLSHPMPAEDSPYMKNYLENQGMDPQEAATTALSFFAQRKGQEAKLQGDVAQAQAEQARAMADYQKANTEAASRENAAKTKADSDFKIAAMNASGKDKTKEAYIFEGLGKVLGSNNPTNPKALNDLSDALGSIYDKQTGRQTGKQPTVTSALPPQIKSTVEGLLKSGASKKDVISQMKAAGAKQEILDAVEASY